MLDANLLEVFTFVFEFPFVYLFLVLLEANQIEVAKEVLDKFKEDFPESKKTSILEENLKKLTEESNVSDGTENN